MFRWLFSLLQAIDYIVTGNLDPDEWMVVHLKPDDPNPEENYETR
jgi:hypothetical protein